jgi:uncharacterized damage-inducible protein DinB
MKVLSYLELLCILFGCNNLKDKPALKSILVEQLRYRHNKADWYVPISTAIEGLSSEQANWSDSPDNHSIGQLVAHLTFWNERILIAFQGNTPPAYNDNNKETFTKFDKKNWQQTVNRLDSIQTLWEKAVEGATEKQLQDWSSSIATICSLNAYHTGQIVYIRKKNGWWNESKGVK